MKSIHGHEVLEMMKDHYYHNDEALIEAIEQKFGVHVLFHTCSNSEMTASELVAFLQAKGKFKSNTSDQFTVDSRRICNH